MKLNLSKLVAFGSVYATILLCSCQNEKIEPIKVPVPTDVKFSTEVYPLFASNNCTGCHGNSGGLTLNGTATVVRQNLLSTGSVVANSSATSPLYTKFAGKSHNGISFTAAQVASIKGWIDQGALEN